MNAPSQESALEGGLEPVLNRPVANDPKQGGRTDMASVPCQKPSAPIRSETLPPGRARSVVRGVPCSYPRIALICPPAALGSVPPGLEILRLGQYSRVGPR